MQPPVHAGGAFCGSLVPGGDFCPQAGAFLWKYGAGGDFCPQIGYLLWMRRGNSSRLSTNKAHFVDEMGLCGCHGLRWCLSGVSVRLSGPAKVPLGSLSSPRKLSGPAKIPLGTLRNPPGASRNPPEPFGRITTQTARLQGRGRTCRRCG